MRQLRSITVPSSRLTTTALALAWALMTALIATQPIQAQKFIVLHQFRGGSSSGANPYGGLIRDEAGNLYGTTVHGGTGHNAGTVFRLDTTGTLTILYSFTGERGDGKGPNSGLVRDSEGNLWGALQNGIGHPVSFGFVYKIDTTGNEFKPHVFLGPTSDGASPRAALIRDKTGTFYGTTAGGGAFYGGTVFQMKAGKETVLYNFTGTNGDGQYPEAPLVRDPDGNLYGTTMAGGASTFGTVFKLDKTGKETVLHSFDGPDGAQLGSGLILDQAGNLYGTTITGTTSPGTVFRINTDGSNFSTLYKFTGGKDGSNPLGPIVIDRKGNVYGTTQYGGDLSCGFVHKGCGVVFKLTPSGKETVLHKFSASDGNTPSSGVIRDGKGNLYGTTPRGGNTACPNGCGVVFKITP